MFIYLEVFFLTAMLIYISRNKSIKAQCCFFIIALFIMSVLAGLRSTHIGVDTEAYLNMFNWAKEKTSLLDLLSFHRSLGLRDYGFHTLTYFLLQICSDYHFVLFGYELIIMLFLLLGIIELYKKMHFPVWFAYLLILFQLYNPSLNVIRQCLGVAALFYGLACMMNGKKYTYLFMQCIAYSFHSTALIGIFICGIYYWFKYSNNKSVKEATKRFTSLILLAAVVIFSIPFVLNLFVEMGIVSRTYLLFLPGGVYSKIGSGDYIHPLSVMPSLFYLVLVALHYKQLMNEKYEGLFMVFCCFAVFAASFGPMIAEFIERVGYYFIPFQCVALANVSNVCIPKYRKWYIALVIAAMLVVWIVTVVILGYYGTVPYEFFWNA